jgi:hypothetical protein
MLAVWTRGDARISLAEVRRLAQRPDEAIPALEEAVALYEQKGNEVSASKARALLGQLRTIPSQNHG